MFNSVSKSLAVLMCCSLLLTACKLPGEKDSSNSDVKSDDQQPVAPIDVTPPVEPIVPVEPIAPVEPVTPTEPEINPLVDTERFNKINEKGASLSLEQQLFDMNIEPWACVQDKNADLTWQVPQANGDFAFNHTYYWAERTINHRDYGRAQCGLLTHDGEPIDCNTDAFIQRANDLKLCGKTDWRLASRKEFNSLLNKEYANEAENLAPINAFYFPFVSANGGELYWGDEAANYPNGHDSVVVKDDWQGSNAQVGSAYGVWMDSDFANVKVPPRSANEPHFAMLVSGEKVLPVTPEPTDERVDAITQLMPLEKIDDGEDENNNWKNRFSKLDDLAVELVDQDADSWSCTEDKLYKTATNGLQDIKIVWQRITDTEKQMNYAAIDTYIDNVNTNKLCGKTNWRLPTEKELKSLLVEYNFAPNFLDKRAGYETSVFNDLVVGKNHEESYYWTSTDDEYSDAKKSAVSFQDAFAESSSKDKLTSYYRVRLISTFSLSK
ncbi:Lcl domain-containing protein [Pseudomonas sp. HK3]